MKRVLEIFREICAIPHGSGNMDGIADYCVRFAEKRGLEALRDEANNVIIRKEGVGKLKNAAPLILQGHLDMVCQKDEGVEFDFEAEGIRPRIDGDLMRAEGTTLGGDNGIAVAMTLALLEREELSAPPLEAVFTTDEEIGMLGALKLSPHTLTGKRMINLDAESDDTVTVSCAGGVDLIFTAKPEGVLQTGETVTLRLFGLKGGHSGVEIHQNRANAALLLGKVLAQVRNTVPFSTVSLFSGEKSNAIPSLGQAILLTQEPCRLVDAVKERMEEERKAWLPYEEGFSFSVECGEREERRVLSPETENALYGFFSVAETGVVAMSRKIEGLVETSRNLGILRLSADEILIHYSLRSNLVEALSALSGSLTKQASEFGLNGEETGFYPPWEYREDSPLRGLYQAIFREERGFSPKIEAIHAGLECGVFARLIPDLDCISIGPNLYDIHSPREAMSLSSVERLYRMLEKVLKNCV